MTSSHGPPRFRARRSSSASRAPWGYRPRNTCSLGAWRSPRICSANETYPSSRSRNVSATDRQVPSAQRSSATKANRQVATRARPKPIAERTRTHGAPRHSRQRSFRRLPRGPAHQRTETLRRVPIVSRSQSRTRDRPHAQLRPLSLISTRRIANASRRLLCEFENTSQHWGRGSRAKQGADRGDADACSRAKA